MKLSIPELSLVVLIGPSGSGKSTFARRHFKPTEVLSSDACRGMVSDDENDQSATGAAFEVLHFLARKRLQAARLTVVDATSVQPESRAPLLALARELHAIPVAIVFDLSEKVCRERNAGRPDRDFGPHVIAQQRRQLRQSLRGLSREGFRYVHLLRTPAEADTAEVERRPLWTDRRSERGPFAIIGDVHGCAEELEDLLRLAGFEVTERAEEGGARFEVRHPQGRKAVFLGDLVDRGPRVPRVLRLAMDMVESGVALCLPGNHDVKLLRKLRGKDVRLTHGLAETLSQLEGEPPEFRRRVEEFLDSLVSHYVLDGGRLVVAHAGMKEDLQGRASSRVREFALYGETTGETDEFGLPVRYPWADAYRGQAAVVYGHTPVPEAEWLNGTINIDTGCVFGGKLTALLWPERELVSVPARHEYARSAKPFLPPEDLAPALTAQQANNDLLDLEDVLGKRIVRPRLLPSVTVREENAAAALEVMSRFAVDPRWLIYLPPTMSPCETAREGPYLEHPAQALAHYRTEGVARVVCEEKHMGSRAVAVVCRGPEEARKRFGVLEGPAGIVYTRTGRRFFNDPAMEAAVLDRLREAAGAAGLWEELGTGWLCLDAEVLPWSAKAVDLLRRQYAAVGAASASALDGAVACLERSVDAGGDVAPLLERFRARREAARGFVEAYRRYSWKVESVEDLRLAPFHLLASEGRVHADHPHPWHLEVLGRLCRGGPGLIQETAHRLVDVTDPTAEEEAVRWWLGLTGRGGEGMVVKPEGFLARGRRGLVQPAVKCRGREYLRIIYGPEYLLPENLERLRSRKLAGKRSLALREFALGIEALERFVRREPLRRVHECVFGVLALESEPVDPRL